MTTRVLILGAGFGGLELAAGLSERFGADIDITLIDRSEQFVFGFSKLDVMFGKTQRRPRSATRTAGLTSPECGSSARQSARSTRHPSASTRMRARSRPISSLSRSVPTSTRRRRPALSRAGMSSTRTAVPSRCVTCSPDSAAAAWSSVSHRRRSSARRAERDGPADARVLDRARAACRLRDRGRDADADPGPAGAGRIRSTAGVRSPSAASNGTRSG